MEMSCGALKEAVADFSLIYECAPLEDGTLRVATPFHYPNGSLVDVFLMADVPLPEETAGPPGLKSLIRGCFLSDFGQTMTYLMDLGVMPSDTKRLGRIVRDICERAGVEYRRGELCIWIDNRDMGAIGNQVARLVQACVRVADLSFFKRYSTPPSFNAEVKTFLGPNRTEGPPYAVTGRWGREVKVDFLFHGESNKQSLVKTISTGGSGLNVHPYLTEAFSRWYDLETLFERDRLITLIDDRERINRNDDLDRLKEVSAVFSYPRQSEQIKEFLLVA
jgi:hypothetical protein